MNLPTETTLRASAHPSSNAGHPPAGGVRRRRRGSDARRGLALAVHLARREASAANRYTLLGWTWPVARQLTQLAVLVFIFSAVFDLGIPNYPAFVFSGLIAWSWFASGMTAASHSILAGRHLVMQPGFPTAVLPLVAIAVPLIDVLVALPVLAIMLVLTTGLSPTVLLLPVLLAVQLVLMTGIAWLVAGVSVYLRDVPNLISVGIGVLFYLTPVFYPLTRVPGEYRSLLDLNPLAALLEAYRDVLLENRVPEIAPLAVVLLVGLVLAAAGFALFRRLAAGFAEEL